MNKINWKAFIISLAISLGAGAIARFLTRDSMEQYGNREYVPDHMKRFI